MSLYKTAKEIVKTGLCIVGVGLLSQCSQLSPTAPQTTQEQTTNNEDISSVISPIIIYDVDVRRTSNGNYIQILFEEKDNADSFRYEIFRTGQKGLFKNDFDNAPEINGKKLVYEIPIENTLETTVGRLVRTTDKDGGTQFKILGDSIKPQ